MTFYEAALQILQREGRPLHAREIAELAIKENLLSHVGKQPEVTMASRLAAMARKSADRRLVAVEPDTFALAEWSVEASPDALEKSGIIETPPEDEPLLRSRERHPKIDKENVRVAGRGDRRRKFEELERKKKKKKKRLPPLPELVYEIVDRAGRALPAFELAAAIREHDLVGEDIGREALENALRAENERREGEGRKPVFAFLDEGLIGLTGREEPAEEADLAALVEQVVARLAEERKPAAAAPAPEAAAAPAAAGTLDQLVAQEWSRAVTQLRAKLAELEAPALEGVTQNLLDTLGYRDVRVAKRHREGSLFTAKRRMGLTEIRFAVRVIRGGRDVRREDVLELRRDMQSHSAQIGVVVSPSDPTREARSEAAQAGGALVTLLCADALAEQLAARGLGVRQRTVTVTEFDPAAFQAIAGAQQAQEGAPAAAGEAKRETAPERRERRERERREWREKRAREREERRKAREAAAAAEGAGEGAAVAEVAAGAEGAVAEAGAAEGAGAAEAVAGGEGARDVEGAAAAEVAPERAVDIEAPGERSGEGAGAAGAAAAPVIREAGTPALVAAPTTPESELAAPPAEARAVAAAPVTDTAAPAARATAAAAPVGTEAEAAAPAEATPAPAAHADADAPATAQEEVPAPAAGKTAEAEATTTAAEKFTQPEAAAAAAEKSTRPEATAAAAEKSTRPEAAATAVEKTAGEEATASVEAKTAHAETAARAEEQPAQADAAAAPATVDSMPASAPVVTEAAAPGGPAVPAADEEPADRPRRRRRRTRAAAAEGEPAAAAEGDSAEPAPAADETESEA